MGASGLRSSCESTARNSVLRRSASRSPPFLQRREIPCYVEAISFRLCAEELVVERLVLEEELTRKDIAEAVAGHEERRRDVPHVVLALVELELSRGHVCGELRVALHAVSAGLPV